MAKKAHTKPGRSPTPKAVEGFEPGRPRETGSQLLTDIDPADNAEHVAEPAVEPLPFTRLSSVEKETLGHVKDSLDHVKDSLRNVENSLQFYANELERVNAPTHLKRDLLKLKDEIVDLQLMVYNPLSSVPTESTESQPSPADVARASRAGTSPALPARETKMPKVQTDEHIVEVTLPPDEKLLLGRRPKKLKGRKKMVAHVLQLSLSQQDLSRLERLRELADLRTAADAIRRAMKLYEAALDARNNGKDVIFEGRSGPRERLRF